MVSAPNATAYLAEPSEELFDLRSLFEPFVSGTGFDQFMKPEWKFFRVISKVPEPLADEDISSGQVIFNMSLVVVRILSLSPFRALLLVDIVAHYLPPLPVVVGPLDIEFGQLAVIFH